MNFCKYCGTQLAPNSQFCSNCGRKIIHSQVPKNNITKQHKLLVGISFMILIFTIGAFSWWKYQHPSLQKAVPGSIYKYTVVGYIDGEKESSNGYFIFSKDGRYTLVDSAREANKFKTTSFNKAARTTKDDPERYNYHIDNRNNRIKLHSYILDTTKNASGELLVSDFDSSTMHATFKGSPSWGIDDQSDYNLHFNLTKIGTVK